MKYLKYKSYTDFLQDENIKINNLKIAEINNVHENIKINKYLCLLCAKNFRRLEYLKRHFMCIHENKEIYTCNFCYKKIKRMDNLKKHQLKFCKKQPYIFMDVKIKLESNNL